VARRDIVVVGASAGGIAALQQFALQLPATFDGSIFVTVHFPEHGTSTLPRILNRSGSLSAVHAADGESIVPGRIYVAPPDFHLLLSRRGVRLARGPKEKGNRPAVDSMFRSAAVSFGPRVIGVVLTGNLDDGTAGLLAIKRRGGLGIAQDPSEALFPSMPRSAIEHAAVDRVVPIRDLHKTLAELMAEPILEAPAADSLDRTEADFAAANLDVMQDEHGHPGHPSVFGCPDCGGVLWEVDDGEFTRYRCRVGHAWRSDALLGHQSDTYDDALWTSLRALEESTSLSRRIAARYRKRGSDELADRFEAQARAIEAKAEPVRALLMTHRHAQINPDLGAGGPRRVS